MPERPVWAIGLVAVTAASAGGVHGGLCGDAPLRWPVKRKRTGGGSARDAFPPHLLHDPHGSRSAATDASGPHLLAGQPPPVTEWHAHTQASHLDEGCMPAGARGAAAKRPLVGCASSCTPTDEATTTGGGGREGTAATVPQTLRPAREEELGGKRLSGVGAWWLRR